MAELQVLTHTKRRDFKTCPRYYLHKHINHLTPRRAKRGRRRGAIFGDALEHARITFRESDKHIIKPDHETCLSFFGQLLDGVYERMTEDGTMKPEDADEWDVEQAKIVVMLACYVERYGLDQRREVIFDLPLRNPRTGRTSRAFRLGGKIDGIVVTGEKEAVVIEDKFVGQIQRAMIERLPLDDQVSEYVDAFASKGWTASVWYRHTRYPSINPKPPKEFKTKDNYAGETIREFAERLDKDVHERPDFYFDQQILDFPRLHLDDYRRGRWGTAQKILAARKYVGTEREPEFFEKAPTRCWEYGGCEFIPLCNNTEGARDLYTVEEDNPELQTREGVTSEYHAT